MRTRQPKLLEWLKTASEADIEATRTTRGYLQQISYGNKTASAEIAAAVERATGGLVTRKDLRPVDWPLIWPELAAA